MTSCLVRISRSPNMALSSCVLGSPVCASVKMGDARLPIFNGSCNDLPRRIRVCGLKSSNINQRIGRSVLGQSTVRPNLGSNSSIRRDTAKRASCNGLPSSQIASSAFTWGTVAVLPFYTFMVVAPQAEFSKKLAGSSMPFVFLGALYAYLLYLSWTPDTISQMFASKYWLPELPAMAAMFSSEMTLASAWIHLLAVDLFAARKVYFEGLQERVETRHSVTLCLMFCPIGILSHVITKALATKRKETEHGIH